jgi:hypothetical protein
LKIASNLSLTLLSSSSAGVAVVLEVGVQLPDQSADMRLGGPVGLAEGVRLMDQPLAVDPAQSVAADIELAGVVAQDHRVVEKAMRLDAAP